MAEELYHPQLIMNGGDWSFKTIDSYAPLEISRDGGDIVSRSTNDTPWGNNPWLVVRVV